MYFKNIYYYGNQIKENKMEEHRAHMEEVIIAYKILELNPNTCQL